MVGFGDSFEWGYTRLFSHDAARHCEINGIGVAVDAAPESIALDELSAQIESWVAIAVVWLEVMSNQTLTANEAIRTTYQGGTLHYADASRWAPGDASTKPFFVDDTIDAIRSAGLTHAFEQASSGNTVPIEWRLFLRGRRAHQTEDHRVAIVEAATAVEQALSAAMREVARTQSSGNALQLLSKHLERRTLGAQVVDARSINLLPLPSNTEADLVRARNRTVHDGHQPSEHEAGAALEIAERILREASPLFRSELVLVERRADVGATT